LAGEVLAQEEKQFVVGFYVLYAILGERLLEATCTHAS
jgi:hypothetical protein